MIVLFKIVIMTMLYGIFVYFFAKEIYKNKDEK